MNEESRTDARDDTDLAALLAAVGPRGQPSLDAMASVRAAVAAEWRATVAARQRRHRFTSWAAAAGVAAAAIAACSSASSARLRASPPAYPVSAPSAPTMRWQGTTIDSGLRPVAAPAARMLSGRPARAASSR